jgi:hypothetical protein
MYPLGLGIPDGRVHHYAQFQSGCFGQSHQRMLAGRIAAKVTCVLGGAVWRSVQGQTLAQLDHDCKKDFELKNTPRTFKPVPWSKIPTG